MTATNTPRHSPAPDPSPFSMSDPSGADDYVAAQPSEQLVERWNAEHPEDQRGSDGRPLLVDE